MINNKQSKSYGMHKARSISTKSDKSSKQFLSNLVKQAKQHSQQYEELEDSDKGSDKDIDTDEDCNDDYDEDLYKKSDNYLSEISKKNSKEDFIEEIEAYECNKEIESKKNMDVLNYCSKCYLKRNENNDLLSIKCFKAVHDIVFNAVSMPDVYNKLDHLKMSEEDWLEKNNDGFSVFHWFSWYLSTKINTLDKFKL